MGSTVTDITYPGLIWLMGLKILADKIRSYIISYGAYRYFDEEQRQICWSHLERDFQRFAHSRRPLLACQGNLLMGISQEVFALNKAVNAQKIERLFCVVPVGRRDKG